MESRIANREFRRLGKKVTICSITNDNGYSVRGESACVNPENYNQQIGEKIAGAIPKCRYAAVRLECFFVDGCVDISSPSSSAFNSARHAGGSQRHSVFRSLAIASRV